MNACTVVFIYPIHMFRKLTSMFKIIIIYHCSTYDIRISPHHFDLNSLHSHHIGKSLAHTLHCHTQIHRRSIAVFHEWLEKGVEEHYQMSNPTPCAYMYIALGKSGISWRTSSRETVGNECIGHVLDRVEFLDLNYCALSCILNIKFPSTFL